MQFHIYLASIAAAVRTQDGEKLASLLSLGGTHIPRLLASMHDSSRGALARYSQSIIAPWGDIAIAHVQVVVNADDMPEDAFKEQDVLVNQHFLSRYFKDATSWVLPVLYVFLKDLRRLAEKADSPEYRTTQSSKMEDAARTCNKAFSLCISDRNPLVESRRWGSYYLAGLVMKCYFKIHTISLSRNIIRALNANPEVPPLAEFPKLDQLTYKYYLGLLNFLNEEYQQADENLTYAYDICHHIDLRNQERILTYLIPLRLLRGLLPSSPLLSRHPALHALYDPLIRSVHRGALAAYDAALTASEGRLFRLGVWYVWEKARDLCLRGLFRRVWLATDKNTRIPVSLFHASLRISRAWEISPAAEASGLDGGSSRNSLKDPSRDSPKLSPEDSLLETDPDGDLSLAETECLLANMIYKGLMRGYISHEKQMVVLAAKNAFPRVRDRATPFV